VLRRLRVAISSGQYLTSIHALEEMADDDLFTEDEERVDLAGSLVQRQIDNWRQIDRATREPKYVIIGRYSKGDSLEVIAKIGATGKMVAVTFCREEDA
jgi:hypothetical protein